ncbi:sigma-70 family RNA polymerase sigma factor [Halomicronema sp. CCY15110]|uniref:sigma-70 family RNA polymerase sigma factor n=1 Tax=Halomicronema sp. CCY15110 TaxID=2767773 RepID=UPI0019506FC1|nr:sigma-70 family RNA polymerase sigma factor [Halomicronema sp. CCY15110]
MNKFHQGGSDSRSDKKIGVAPENNLPGRSHGIHLETLQCTSEAELHEMTKLLAQENPNDFFAYVNKSLWQFNLYPKYQALEIVGESYSRAVKKIRKGEEIPNLRGWYKITSLNIVREYSRIELKQRKIKASMSACLDEEYTSGDEELPRYSIESIKRIINNELNYKILCLRVLHEKTWDEVCQTLINDGDFNSELSKQFIDMIKRRFYRALKKIPKPRE